MLGVVMEAVEIAVDGGMASSERMMIMKIRKSICNVKTN